MTQPAPRVGWFARIALWVVVLLVPTLVLFLALGLAFGAWLALFVFVLAALSMVYAYGRGMNLRDLMRADQAAAFRDIDRRAAREGKFFAGIAFVTMGVGTLAIIAVFATHL